MRLRIRICQLKRWFCISVISRLEEDISNMSIQLSDFQSYNEELSETKVQLEIRSIQIEEQRDRASDEAKDLQVTIDNLKAEIKVIDDLINAKLQLD